MHWLRTAGIVILALLILAALLSFFTPAQAPRSSMTLAYSDVLREVDARRIQEVVLRGRSMTGIGENGRTFEAYLPDDPSLASRLVAQGIRVVARPEETDTFISLAISWIPLLLYFGVMWALLRQMNAGFQAVSIRLDQISAELATRPAAPSTENGREKA